MHICEHFIESSRYLEKHGFTQKQLTSLHHRSLKGGQARYASVYKYFGGNKELQTQNTHFAKRVIYVATQHKTENGAFTQLISQALDRWPLTLMNHETTHQTWPTNAANDTECNSKTASLGWVTKGRRNMNRTKYPPNEKKHCCADLILQLLNYRRSLIDNQLLNECYEYSFRGLITRLLWFDSEAHGKYKGCRHWSKAAWKSYNKHGEPVTSKSKYGDDDALRHEHLFPRNDTIELLFKLDEPDLESVLDHLKRNIGVVVTVREDNRLAKKGNPEDPWQRYRNANIEWQEIEW